jgi:hypothetical protein
MVSNTRWEATQRVMAPKLTRLTHKLATQLHLLAESYTISSSRSRRSVRKLLDTPSYVFSEHTAHVDLSHSSWVLIRFVMSGLVSRSSVCWTDHSELETNDNHLNTSSSFLKANYNRWSCYHEDRTFFISFTFHRPELFIGPKLRQILDAWMQQTTHCVGKKSAAKLH